MPGDLPIGPRLFVEEDTSHEKCTWEPKAGEQCQDF